MDFGSIITLASKINWFDILVLAMIVLGANVGRKRGLSQEIGVCLQWVGIVLAGAFLYRPLGDDLADAWPFSHLFCYIIAYIGAALIVKFVFGLVTKQAGGKLFGSSTFGWGEYYLGAVAGAVRFLCVLFAAMALLNAKQSTVVYAKPAAVPGQIALKGSASTKNITDLSNAALFPDVGSVQEDVFRHSVLGQAAKKYMGGMLISPTALEKKTFRRKEALPAALR